VKKFQKPSPFWGPAGVWPGVAAQGGQEVVGVQSPSQSATSWSAAWASVSCGWLVPAAPAPAPVFLYDAHGTELQLTSFRGIDADGHLPETMYVEPVKSDPRGPRILCTFIRRSADPQILVVGVFRQ
jgi:hypothetical protein